MQPCVALERLYHKVPVISILPRTSIDDNPMIEHALKILHAHTFYLGI